MFAHAKQNEVFVCNFCEFHAKSLSGLVRHRNYHGHDTIMTLEPSRLSKRSSKRRKLTEEKKYVADAPQANDDDNDEECEEERTQAYEDNDDEGSEEESEEEDDKDDSSRDEEVDLCYDDLEEGAKMFSSKFLQQQLNFRPDELTRREKACLQFAAFSTRVGLGRVQVEALLTVLKSGLDVEALPKTQRTLDKEVEQAIRKTRVFSSGTNDDQQKIEIDISDLNPHLPEVTFYFRDPLVAALELLTSVYQMKGDLQPAALNWKSSVSYHPETGVRMFKGTSGYCWPTIFFVLHAPYD